ncbi:hypothetical protein MGG_17051 [Pyricularia oryzae 70-15]|uniref:Uncharacterized protein n=1 Tax=Pyricularia oryzae (strain 70-15 / ATCC MYA-4617 / FGSC 8958) TaxID=242507 RepID=G4N6R5_PYRO7|nr:uncharacterized protein MGG_17051 [Pyricularia oryzae 70-15]EHA49882.1 hypothetical protein MGG_17051 [Pyricularia oryzae 70-15]
MNFILVVYFKKERSWGMVLARMMDTYLTYLPTYLLTYHLPTPTTHFTAEA